MFKSADQLPRATYTLIARTDDYVALVDTGDSVSVTNDAEHVVQYLAKIFNPELRIFYKDTIGHWDELVHDHGKFKTFKGGIPERVREQIEAAA